MEQLLCVCVMVQGQREGEGKNRTEKVIFGDTDFGGELMRSPEFLHGTFEALHG